MVASFSTASTAVTESICALGALGSDVFDFTETSKFEFVSLLDSFDKIKFSSHFYRYFVKVFRLIVKI